MRHAPTTADENQYECRGQHDLGKNDHDPSGFVRKICLTDRGEFADRCELTDVTYAIRNAPGPLLAVWYIHGWKHHAESEDFDRFRDLITALEAQQQSVNEQERRHVVGVYGAWDGAIGPGGFLQNTTFWSRKRAADRISQSAVLTRVFAATKFARQQADVETDNDLTVMIGHSFGARLLFTATSQVLMTEIQRRHPGKKYWGYDPIEGLADLTVLLNPAFEASIFTTFDTIRRQGKEWEEFSSVQRPVVLSISTDNDRATSWAYPLGQRIGLAATTEQRTTLGNHLPYMTHRLEVHMTDPPSPSTVWFDDFDSGGLRLRRIERDQQEFGNPFVVAGTNRDVIDGHGGIWDDRLREWVIAFLAKYQRRAQPADTSTRA